MIPLMSLKIKQIKYQRTEFLVHNVPEICFKELYPSNGHYNTAGIFGIS